MPWTVLYFFLFVYSFNLCNQIAGVEEDKIDKPDRPIPSGMLTLTGARYRWYTVTTLYVLANITIGNLWSPFLWIIITLMNSYGGWDKHWFTKNCVCMTLGTLAISWAGWSIVNGHVWMDQKYVTITTVLSLYAGVTANLQDLRDVEGDRKSGRITMPICYGMSTSRQLLSIVFLIEPVILYFTVWNSPFNTATVAVTAFFKIVYISADILAHLYIAIRLSYLDHTYSDLHHTYHFFTKTFPFTVMSATVAVCS